MPTACTASSTSVSPISGTGSSRSSTLFGSLAKLTTPVMVSLINLFLFADRNVAVGVDLVGDHAQLALEVAARGLERVGIDGQRRAQHDERGSVLGRAHGLLDGEAADRLHRHADRRDDLAQLVE